MILHAFFAMTLLGFSRSHLAAACPEMIGAGSTEAVYSATLQRDKKLIGVQMLKGKGKRIVEFNLLYCINEMENALF